MTQFSQLPPLRDVIRDYDLRAKKSFGQNFLLDLNLTRKIVRTAGDLSSQTVFEIGPGPGGLTRALLETGAKKIIALEKDSRCVRALQSLTEAANGRLQVMEADALKTDLPALAPPPRAVIANLPYNIATPLLIKWLSQSEDLEKMVLMFQKEVADRLTAKPKTKAYGRLSVITQWRCQVRPLFDIPASAFTPPPKVTSTVVEFIPRKMPEDAPSFTAMEAVTAKAFGQRRKMLRKNFENLESMDIPETARAEDLSVEDFVRLAARP